MKILKRIMAFVLLMVLSSALFTLPAAATTTISRQDGLEVTVEMDKEVYDAGEPITATITVKNTSGNAMTIANLEQLIPEGYNLSKDSKAAAENIELRPNQTFQLEVTFEGGAGSEAEASTQSFFDKVIYGQTKGIPNLLIAVLVVIGFAVFMLLT